MNRNVLQRSQKQFSYFQKFSDPNRVRRLSQKDCQRLAIYYMTTELAIFRCLETRFLVVPVILIIRQCLDLDETSAALL